MKENFAHYFPLLCKIFENSSTDETGTKEDAIFLIFDSNTLFIVSLWELSHAYAPPHFPR